MEESGFEYQKYLKMVIKRRYLFIILSFVIMSVIVWGSYLLPKKYEAKSTIFIESNVIKELVKGIAITPEMGDRVRIVGYTMLSRGLIAETLKTLDQDTLVKDPAAFERMVTDFQKRTNIELKLRDNLFMVSLEDRNPRLARDYINTLVSKYVEMNLSAKKEEAFGASTFLAEQVTAAKERLDKAEQDIINFRREKGVYMAKDEASLLGEIRSYNDQIQNIRMRRNELAATTSSLRKQLKGEDPMIPVFTSSRTAPAVGRTMQTAEDRQIALLEEKLKLLMLRFKDNYPEVVKVKSEIEILKKQKKEKLAAAEGAGTSDQAGEASAEENLATFNPTYQLIKDKLLSAEAELSALEANQNHLASMIRQREGELRSMPTERKPLLELINERDAQKKLHDELKIRLEQSQVSKQMEVSDKSTTFRIVDPAVIPQKPVSPNRVMIILMGIIAGFGGGFGGVFLRETVSSSVKSVQALKDLGLPVLAVVPMMYNETELAQEAKRGKLLYAVAGGYFALICLVLVLEIAGVTFMDKVVAKLHLDRLVDSLPFGK